MNHLDEAQLIALVDGGVAPNEEGPLRSHLSQCGACRASLEDFRRLADDLGLDGEGVEQEHEPHVQRVMAAIRAGRREAPPSRRRGARVLVPRWAALGVSSLAVAAGVALVLRSRGHSDMGGEVTARGAASNPAVDSLERAVGIRLFRGGERLVPIVEGSVLPPSAAFTAAYVNLRSSPARALVFAVDASGAVHWLFPAYTVPGSDPESVVLEQAMAERPLPTSVVLEALARGEARLITVVTEEPHRVSEIEGRAPSALDRRSLARDLRAVVTEVNVEIGGER